MERKEGMGWKRGRLSRGIDKRPFDNRFRQPQSWKISYLGDVSRDL